ncbi:MAG: hypothetical protein ACRDIA_08630, partial [Actinomycetota bacterium]
GISSRIHQTPGASVAEAPIELDSPKTPGGLIQSPTARSLPARSRRNSACMGLGLAGTAGVFLVNSVVAFIDPGPFVDLVRNSPLGAIVDFMDSGVLGFVIGTNDLLLGAALLVAVPKLRLRPVAFAWAGLWLLAVSLLKLTSLSAFDSMLRAIALH